MSESQVVLSQLNKLEDASLYIEGASEYKESVESYFTLQNSSLRPIAILRPRSTTSLSKAISILAEADIIFSVRSGGHYCTAGAANQNGGVTIDLRSFNDVEVVNGGKSVRLGTGSTWGRVYKVLDTQGLSVAGGRETTVGVGGLILGGGISYFSGLVGMTCDNVEDYEVVLASGEIVHANAEENPDLFRALRGGSNNFGVVTHFTMRCFVKRDVWAGEVVQPLSTKDEQLKAFYEYANRSDSVHGGNVIHSWVKSDAMGEIVVTALVHADADPKEEPQDFAAFRNIKPQYAHRFIPMNVTDFALERDKYTPNGSGNIFIGTTSRLSSELLHRSFTVWEESQTVVREIPGIRWAMTLQVITPAVIKRSPFLQEVLAGTDSGSLVKEDFAPIIIYLLAATWNRLEDSERVETEARKAIKDLDKDINERGMTTGYRYLNYSDPSQDVYGDGTADGGTRKKWLQEVSTKYDPKGVFQKQVVGGFKLFT